MPTYEYQSDDGAILEIFKSIKEEIPQEIIEDGKLYKRVISLPTIIVDSSKPKTIGMLAQKNTEKKIKKGELKETKKKKKIDLSLAKMSNAQKERYIWTGQR